MGMGAVTLSGGMVLYTLGSRVVPAAELALLSNIEVMLAPVWVWLVLGETASATTLLGGGILLARGGAERPRRRPAAGAGPGGRLEAARRGSAGA